MKYSWIDPPDGWRYGFPKAFTFQPSSLELSVQEREDEFCKWLEFNGYPIEKVGRWALNHMRYGIEN